MKSLISYVDSSLKLTIVLEVHKVVRVSYDGDGWRAWNQITKFSLASVHLPEMNHSQSDDNGDKRQKQRRSEGRTFNYLLHCHLLCKVLSR